MSAFISSTWQATNARILDTGVRIPVGQLPSMVGDIIEGASPATAAETLFFARENLFYKKQSAARHVVQRRVGRRCCH